MAAIGNIAALVATAPNLSGDWKQYLTIVGSAVGIIGTTIASIAGLATPPPVAVGGAGVAGGPAAGGGK